MSDTNDVYIVAGCRTPIGNFGGSLKSSPAHELGSIVIKHVLQKACIKPEQVSEVIMGQVLAGGQGPNPARLASLKAGIPNTVPAYTVNMLCGSGLKSVYLGYQSIKCGDATIVVAGGQESMSMAHHSIMVRTGIKYGNGQLTDHIMSDGLTDPTLNMAMGDTAEHLAQKYHITRIRQDEFAQQSQSKYAVSKLNGYCSDEIIPVTIKTGKDKESTLSTDEFPRPNTTVEGLSKLRPAFKGGEERTVTAGNSSGINDGAAAVILCTKEETNKLDSKCLARIVGFAQSGLDPVEMGLGPIQAVRNLLQKVKWNMRDVDLFEINEAFAVQSLIVQEVLEIPEDKLNITGGALALGHPLGCSGTRVLVTLLYNMQRLNKKRGIAALCIGGGMGIAIAVERP